MVAAGGNAAATGNLFVGNLSWNVDEEWLRSEFEEFGELSGVRIVTDRESGRSRGYDSSDQLGTTD
jgi:nucleolin